METLSKVHDMFPVPSWYTPSMEFSEAQLAYIALLEEGFQMIDPLGNPIPYRMTGYQKEFHAQSFNVLLGGAKDILFDKARGISFTYSSLIEMIMTAVDDSFQKQIIPIITHREKNSIEILNVAKLLIDNCKIKEVRDNAVYTDSSPQIYFKNTKSKIQVFPSGDAADALRSQRLIRGMIDEFAFQRNAKKLWAAAKSTMRSEMGQWIIGSTPNGKNNMYYDLTNKAKKGDTSFYYFYLPVFNPEYFDVNKSILKQDLTPIAPWINLKKLEADRLADEKIFLQENMCDTLDVNTVLLSYNSIMRCVSSKLTNYRDEWLSNPLFRYNSANKIHGQIDVAKNKDFFSVTAFEELWVDGECYLIQRWLDYFTGKTTPELEDYTRKFINVFPSMESLRIDKTGIGEYLPEYLAKDFKKLIVPIDFRWKLKINDSDKVRFPGQKDEKISIRKIMGFGAKRLVDNQKIFFIKDKMLITHLNTVNYNLEVDRKTVDGVGQGHGDIFWCIGMASLVVDEVMSKSKSKTTSVKFRSDGGQSYRFGEYKDEDGGVMSRLKYYKKTS